jgi:sorbitol-specific phosphotransferase system component IIC
MDQHIKVVGILSIVFGVLMALLGLFLFGIIAGAGAISGEIEAAWVTGIVGTFVGGLLVLLSLPSIIGGVGLLKRRQWARILIMIVAILSLLNFPFGTAYGVYAIFVLMHEETKPLFA